MKRSMYVTLLVFLLLAIMACGCSRKHSVAQDPGTARRLLDQVYTGSLGSIQGELERSFQKGNPDRVTAGTSAALRHRYGAIRNLKLQSIESIPQMNATVAIWTVTAERDTFEMKVAFVGNNKVTGLWFRPSPSQSWTPSHMLGLDYLGKQKKT